MRFRRILSFVLLTHAVWIGNPYVIPECDKMAEFSHNGCIIAVKIAFTL